MNLNLKGKFLIHKVQLIPQLDRIGHSDYKKDYERLIESNYFTLL